jgi:hypothetical protein
MVYKLYVRKSKIFKNYLINEIFKDIVVTMEKL